MMRRQFDRDPDSGLLLPSRRRHSAHWQHPTLGCGPTFFGGGSTLDPYTAFLWHADNLSNDATGKTLTAGGNVSIDTSIYKFNGSSALFDGTTDYVSVPDSAAWPTVLQTFCVEGWSYIPSYGTDRILVTKRSSSANFAPFQVYVTAAGKLGGLVANSGGTAWTMNVVGATSLPTNTWFHWALFRPDASNFFLAYNGGIEGTKNQTFNLFTNTQPITIGANGNGTFSLAGNTDEVRISVGSGRYSGSGFTPPAAPFSLYL